MLDMERRSNSIGLTPREAAFVTELSEKTINQAIDRNEIEPLPARRRDDAGRALGYPDLVYLRLRIKVGPLLSPEGKRRLREEITEAVREGPRPSTVDMGGVKVTVAYEIEVVEERLTELARARSFVVTDPRVRAGEPVVRGTRIEVQTLADLANQGVSREDLLEDFPSLTPESLDAALLYARTYPRRGRPRSAPWKDGVVVRKTV